VLVVGDGTVGLLAAHLVGQFKPSRVVVLGLRPEQEAMALAAGASVFTTSADEAGAGYDLVVRPLCSPCHGSPWGAGQGVG
jgi:threonine dehydrogenase-like Zn-dependent dehydrogenase